MAKRKMTPLAQTLVLVDSLSAEETATLSDYLRGKQPARPKSTSVPSAAKRSPRSKSGEESKVNTEGATGNASPAAVCAVPKCGLDEDALVHIRGAADDHHEFHAAIKTKGAGV